MEIVPLTADAALLPRGVSVVELSVPVTAEAALLPSGVSVVEFKVPVTTEEFMVPVTADVPSIGTPAGHAFASVPTVNAPLCPSAGTVRLGAVALQAFVAAVPCAIFVAAQFPVVAVATFASVPRPGTPLMVGTPAGQECVCAAAVRAFTVCAAAVKARGVSAGTVVEAPVKVCAAAVRLFTVSAGTVVELPVKPCAAAVNDIELVVGVIEAEPTAPPTSAFAATVP